MEKLKELASLCLSMDISVNDHKGYYSTVAGHIDREEEDIDEAVFAEMVKRDTIVKVQVHPRTPVGFYTVYHYDVCEAIEIALNVIKNDY